MLNNFIFYFTVLNFITTWICCIMDCRVKVKFYEILFQILLKKIIHFISLEFCNKKNKNSKCILLEALNKKINFAEIYISNFWYIFPKFFEIYFTLALPSVWGKKTAVPVSIAEVSCEEVSCTDGFILLIHLIYFYLFTFYKC